MASINSKKTLKWLGVLCGAFDVCRCVLWHCDMEQSHSSSHSFFIILEAVLACNAVLQNERGGDSKDSHGGQGLADVLTRSLKQLLPWHPGSAASTSVCLTWCHSPCVVIVLQPSGWVCAPLSGYLALVHVVWPSHCVTVCSLSLCLVELLVTVPCKNCSPIWRWWHSLSRLNKHSYSHSPWRIFFSMYFVLEFLQCIYSLS